MKTLSFNQLRPNKLYHLIHANGDNWRYAYRLENDGRLFNVTKRRFSSVPFNVLISFVEIENNVKSYPTLRYNVEFRDNNLKVGCQTLSRDDAFELALDIIEYYSE